MSFINIRKGFFSNTAFVVMQRISDYIENYFYEKFNRFGCGQEYCIFCPQAVCTTLMQKNLSHFLLSN